MPALEAVAAAVDALLEAEGHDEPSGILQAAAKPVRALGLALAPTPELGGWVRAQGLDALLLHRSHGFEAPAGLGLLGYHGPFDARLGLARNPWLAEALGLDEPEPVAPKLSVANAPPDARERVVALFGGVEDQHPGVSGVTRRVALADAMTDALVRSAAEHGAGLYVTGQWRKPGALAVAETGLAVLAVGHARSERWGLELLARLVREALPDLRVEVFR